MNKILIVTSEFPPGPGGIGNHAYNLAKNLAINNFNVEVVTDQYEIDNNNEEVFDNKQLFSIKRVGIKKIRLLMYLDRFLLVLKLMRNNQVIIASGKFPLWIVSFSTLYYRRKFIAIIHGTEVNFKSKVLRKSIELSLTKFDVIIAVSNFTKSLVDHLKLKKIVVINNGFDVNKFKLIKKNTLPIYLIKDPEIFLQERLVSTSLLCISCHSGILVHSAAANKRKLVDILNHNEILIQKCWAPLKNYYVVKKSDQLRRYNLQVIFDNIRNYSIKT